MVKLSNKDLSNSKQYFPFKSKNSPSFKNDKISLYSDNNSNGSNRTMFKSFLEFKNGKDKLIKNIHATNKNDGKKVNFTYQPTNNNSSIKRISFD